MSILSWIFYLIVASVCAFIAECAVPNKMPGGFVVSAIVGIIGAWIGGNLVGHIGPDLAGVALIPCILGSALLVFLLSLLSGGFNRRNA
jgi:uncharacterized membrane protein YeaQ/YmgE (transglycosylase-associated protein family)